MLGVSSTFFSILHSVTKEDITTFWNSPFSSSFFLKESNFFFFFFFVFFQFFKKKKKKKIFDTN